MSKYNEVYADTQRLFDSVIDETGLEQVINFKVLSCNSLKKKACDAVKAGDIVKYMTEKDIIILVNEPVFERLTEEQRKIAAEEAVAKVGFDYEKDKIVMSQPDVSTFSLVLVKHGNDKVIQLKDAVRLAFSSLAEQEG